MTIEQREERRLAFYRAATAVAKELHRKEFCELSNSDGATVVGVVYDRHPELRSAFDEPVGGVGKVEPPPPSGDADFSLRGRTPSIVERFGFSQDDIKADPLKASLVGHIARSEQQATTVDEFEEALAAIGKKHNLSPHVHAERCEIANIMARSGHPLASRS